MSVGCYSEDSCLHEGWECRGGWHDCNDCGRGLGSRDNKLEEHAAETCSLCGPIVLDTCCHDEAVVCRNCTTSSCIHNELIMCTDCTKEVEDRLGPVDKFVTKDSGARQQFESGMQRDTQEGKARFDLLFPLNVPYEAQFMTRCAELLARGAEKYESRNWEQAEGEAELERFKASAFRHLMQWVAGDTDEDHAAAVVFNLLGYETTKWKQGNSG